MTNLHKPLYQGFVKYLFNSKPTHFVTKKVTYYYKNNKNKLKLYKSCIYEITNNKHVCKQKILS